MRRTSKEGRRKMQFDGRPSHPRCKGHDCESLDTMSLPADRKIKLWSVVRVSSGNFLEMYDFMVFGYYASAIGRAFFPSGNAYLSLMLSLMTFGAGFLMRP